MRTAREQMGDGTRTFWQYVSFQRGWESAGFAVGLIWWTALSRFLALLLFPETP